MANYSERFEKHPSICGGKPVIRDTRITVKLILDLLASGLTVEEIVDDYPESLVKEDVYAVIQFAVDGAADDEFVPMPAAEE